MIKETFEKEPYTAPQWGMKAITLERYILETSPGRPGGDEPIIDDNTEY